MGHTLYLGLCCLLSCLVFKPSVEGAADPKAAPRSSCRSGTLYYQGYCYDFVNSHVSWDTAYVRCQELSVPTRAHLASILSPREGSVINSYLSNLGQSSVWIGLEATPSVGRLIWAWSDRSLFTSPLWDGRSPTTSLSSQQCVSLYNIGNSYSQKWIQRYCSESLPFLCKYKASN